MKSGAIDGALYFAYGSNLLAAQLRRRVTSARSVCAAWIDGHRLSFGKLGRDGSGKATLVQDAGARVWGALYTIDPAQWEVLDGFEPGYTRIQLEVTSVRREQLIAATYVAPETAPDPVPLPSYKSAIIEGAREHGLPGEYIEALLRLPERPELERVSRAAPRAGARRP